MCSSIEKDEVVSKWRYFLRQFLICSGVWSWPFLNGLNTGTSTVLVPQLRQEANSTDAVTSEEASWLPAIPNYSGIPWVFFICILAAYKGRKICQFIVGIITLIGYVTFYCSSNIHHIMISQFFQGASMASHLTTVIFIITEYTSPEHRGLLFTIKTATFYWGVLFANVIGTFFHWKKIACIGLLSSFYSLGTVYFWPESPLWLAKQGRFDECIKSHKWLQGVGENFEKVLKHYEIITNTAPKNVNLKQQIINLKNVILNKQFRKALCLVILLFSLYVFSGKLVCTVYALEILNKIASDKSSAYAGMLILDGVTVFSMYVGCGLAKVFNRRTLLLTSSSISIFFLFSISLYLYLIKSLILLEDKYVSLSLLAGFSIAIGAGPLILTVTVSGELVPIDSRSFAMIVSGCTINIMIGSLFKGSPYLFKCFGIHGTFFFFGVSSLICLVLTYIYVPETKDKTLQEIADSIMGVNPVVETEAETRNTAHEKLLNSYNY